MNLISKWLRRIYFTAHGCWKSNRKDLCLGYWCGRSKESKVIRFNVSLDITFYHSLLFLICYPARLSRGNARIA